MGSATPWQVLSGLLFLASVGVVVYLVFVIMERDDLAEKVAKLEQENLEYQNNYLAATPRPVGILSEFRVHFLNQRHLLA